MNPLAKLAVSKKVRRDIARGKPRETERGNKNESGRGTDFRREIGSGFWGEIGSKFSREIEYGRGTKFWGEIGSKFFRETENGRGTKFWGEIGSKFSRETESGRGTEFCNEIDSGKGTGFRGEIRSNRQEPPKPLPPAKLAFLTQFLTQGKASLLAKIKALGLFLGLGLLALSAKGQVSCSGVPFYLQAPELRQHAGTASAPWFSSHPIQVQSKLEPRELEEAPDELLLELEPQEVDYASLMPEPEFTLAQKGLAGVEITPTSPGSCNSANVLSEKLITDICWDCMFPMRISGVKVSGGKGRDDIPSGSVSQPVCSCKRKGDFPQVGYTLGFWQPIRLVELVRTPGCMMSLNGKKIKLGRAHQLGTRGSGELDTASTGFYHYHFYAFPLLQILGLLNKDLCFSNEFSSIDVLYVSEIDPSWNYPEIAQLVFPETRAFARKEAILACGADAMAHLGQKSSSFLPWCAGTWGNVYPISGFDVSVGSGARMTSLLATRALAASHRRGFEVRTMGKDALCQTSLALEFLPEQYRFSMFYPMPQNSKHPIGRSTFMWGEAANAEDAVYVVWRWRDCCSALFLK
ncbi:hypothetical protein CJP74_00865 [Psittacicella melopsittaci]|uniref:Uncharacterized protein n=1 Tax=Psittacicella melopsittaci TaxID=2028576 RepID=A0A3A1Y8F3_9GAMM|nr:hypothetical protein CJP74_00865 [Psittacicella melopsittaci]